jgi:hypothetical protein
MAPRRQQASRSGSDAYHYGWHHYAARIGREPYRQSYGHGSELHAEFGHPRGRDGRYAINRSGNGDGACIGREPYRNAYRHRAKLHA